MGILLQGLAAYLAADFATGLLHWACDTYGSSEHWLFGRLTWAMRSHHLIPFKIMHKSAWEIVRPAAIAVAPFAALSLWLGHGMGVWMFYGWLVCSQLIHREAHISAAHLFRGTTIAGAEQEPPPVSAAARVLQDFGIFQRPEPHWAHHTTGNSKYCTIGNLMNAFLDHPRIRFWRRCEAFLASYQILPFRQQQHRSSQPSSSPSASAPPVDSGAGVQPPVMYGQE